MDQFFSSQLDKRGTEKFLNLCKRTYISLDWACFTLKSSQKFSKHLKTGWNRLSTIPLRMKTILKRSQNTLMACTWSLFQPETGLQSSAFSLFSSAIGLRSSVIGSHLSAIGLHLSAIGLFSSAIGLHLSAIGLLQPDYRWKQAKCKPFAGLLQHLFFPIPIRLFSSEPRRKVLRMEMF